MLQQTAAPRARGIMHPQNAHAAASSYGDFWSHLKSMDWALERTLKSGHTERPAPLDLERLAALTKWLRDNLTEPKDNDLTAVRSLLSQRDPFCASSFGIDLRAALRDLPELKRYGGAKTGFDRKMRRLISKTDDFLGGAADQLFGEAVPREEFEVLRAVMGALLRRTGN